MGRRVQAGLADYVELDSMPQNFAGNFDTNSTYQSLDGGIAELFHCPTTDANQVMVMLHLGQAILCRTVPHDQLANHTGVQQQSDSPINSRAAHTRLGPVDLLSAEPIGFSIEKFEDVTPGLGQSVTHVLHCGHQVWTNLGF